MKKIIYLILVILYAQNSFSQIDNCSECDSKIYTYQDISHLSLLELKVLRNEIFARHQYVFKDDRLSDYYIEKYTWYKPDYDSENSIVLNTIEKQNISLFSKYENKKEALKNTIIKELKETNRAFLNNNTLVINVLLHNKFYGLSKASINDTKNELKSILSATNVDNINWYNENGLYKVTTDNGYIVNELSVTINSDTIILQFANTGQSELFVDDTSFQFGSNYYSESEYNSWYIFKIIEDKLVFIEYQAAG
jgi:hypothetical protein